MEIIGGILLGIQSIWDIRYKKIPTIVSVIAGGIGLGFSLWQGRNIWDLCLALIPGVGGLIWAYGSRETIGFGDGILVCALGFLYPISRLWIMCMIAFCFGGIAGLFLLMILQKKKNYEIPFVPFLFLGWLIGLLGAI